MVLIKNLIVRFLRFLNLLSLADFIMMKIKYYRFKKKIFEFKQKNNNFLLPPWNIAYDAYGALIPEIYIESGKNDANNIVDIIQRYRIEDQDLIICDYGCGPMRVLRFLPEIFNKNYKYIGLDFNKDSIKWAKKNFKDFEFKLNNLSPPIPLKDESIDVIYLISVFTHLSEKTIFEYVKEFSRILKKEGIIIATFNGEYFKYNLLSSERDELSKKSYVERKIRKKEGSRLYASYHSEDFIMNIFKNFKFLEKKLDLQGITKQEWWVFKK